MQTKGDNLHFRASFGIGRILTFLLLTSSHLLVTSSHLRITSDSCLEHKNETHFVFGPSISYD